MQFDIWRFSLVIILASGIGLVLGSPLLAMLVAAIGVIVWQSLQLNALTKWVRKPNKNPMRNSHGQVYQLHRELNKQKLTSLRQKRQLSTFVSQFRKAISALPDAIVLIDDTGKIEWANANANSILGIKWPDDAEVRFTDLIRYPEVAKLLNVNVESDQGVEISSTKNREKTINIKCVRYTNELRMLIASDVSRLVKVNQMHADFVANVSHELKTPLTVLRGYLEIMRDNADLPQQMAKPIQQMSRQSERMQFIVSDLLYLAKLEDNHNVATHKAVDLAHIVNTVIEVVQPLIDKKHHKLELDIDPNMMLVGAHNELHSAFNNLISNAIHYTPDQGLIIVRWSRDKNGAIFSVKDNGRGIPAQHLSRITQRFYRVDADRSREGGGTGLGLAIVKHVLQRHDGKLEIISTEGVGSEFQCQFLSGKIVEKVANTSATSTL